MQTTKCPQAPNNTLVALSRIYAEQKHSNITNTFQTRK